MREILFRGKRLDNSEWVYGYLVKKHDPLLGIANFFILVQEMDHSCITGEPTILRSEMTWFKVDPKSVGEFTGLTDKNGTRIFEGDILRIARKSDGIGTYYIPPLEFPVNVIVKWDMCAWMWETLCEDKRYITFPEAWCHYECEVIGNIHDNKEHLYDN